MTHGQFPYIRGRRLRSSSAVRSMVAEHALKPADFIAPVFVMEGENRKAEIPSMPDYYRYTVDKLLGEIGELRDNGIRSVLIFAKVPEEKKDNRGSEAVNAGGLMQRTVRAVTEAYPAMLVMTDIALEPYSSYGHDGIVENGNVLNDESVEILARIAVSHAEAGAD